MDKTYFLCLFILGSLISASLSAERPPKLKLKRFSLSKTPTFFSKNTSQALSQQLSSFFSVDVYLTPDDQKSVFPMAIALYSSTTVLIAPTGECQHFVPFDCQTFDCLQYQNNKTSASYPYFNAYGYFGKTYLYLDFANWNLETKTIMATSCLDSKWPSYCAGTYGMLGMGVAVSSWANFRGLQPLFSISIDLDQQNGEISFSLDSTKFKQDIPPVTLFADNNWRVLNIQSIQVGQAQIPTSNFSLSFDINLDALGFPLSIYESLLKSFTGPDQRPLECNQTYYKPACNYSGNITDLSAIYIHIGNQKIIQIPPEVFIEQGFKNTQSTGGSIVLNIKAVDPSLSDPLNYVRKDFANYIFLDSNFFHHYYAVFNGSNYTQKNNTILLYQASHPRKQVDGQDRLMEIIIFGCVIFAFLIVIFSCSVQKCRKRKPRLGFENPVEIVAEQNCSNYENSPEKVLKSAFDSLPREKKEELLIKRKKTKGNSCRKLFRRERDNEDNPRSDDGYLYFQFYTNDDE